MNVVQLIALILFLAAGALVFFPRIDHRAAWVCVALAGALLTLDVAGVIEA